MSNSYMWILPLTLPLTLIFFRRYLLCWLNDQCFEIKVIYLMYSSIFRFALWLYFYYALFHSLNNYSLSFHSYYLEHHQRNLICRNANMLHYTKSDIYIDKWIEKNSKFVVHKSWNERANKTIYSETYVEHNLSLYAPDKIEIK